MQAKRNVSTSDLLILDAGSGAGYFLLSLESFCRNATIVGGDFNSELLHVAQDSISHSVLVQFDVEHLPFGKSVFDVVFSLQVIEHVPNPALAIAEFTRVSKAQGYIAITTPNPAGVAARVLGPKWQGIKEDHISLKSPIEWQDIFAECGLSVLEGGTTGLTGLGVFKFFPLNLLNHIPMAIWCFFPWYWGESYAAIISHTE
jgi:SAM-dependent methyltransferase